MRATLLGLTMILAGCSASHDRSIASAPVSPPVSATVVPHSGASTIAHVRPKPLVTPQSGASEAARVAGAESRKVTIPKTRDVPASSVTSRPSPTTLATPRRAGTSGIVSAARDLPRGVPYASNTDPVRIVSFALSSTIFHPGDNVTGDVVTTSNAASVTARVGSIAVTVPKVAPGKFHLQLQLPSMPLPPGDAKLIITAVRTDGKSATREIAITVAL